jgi:hypothetical protein
VEDPQASVVEQRQIWMEEYTPSAFREMTGNKDLFRKQLHHYHFFLTTAPDFLENMASSVPPQHADHHPLLTQ